MTVLGIGLTYLNCFLHYALRAHCFMAKGEKSFKHIQVRPLFIATVSQISSLKQWDKKRRGAKDYY